MEEQRVDAEGTVISHVFNTEHLWPGMILHPRSRTVHGWAIRRAIGSWGNHDALVDCIHGQWYALDSQPHRARATPLEDYAAEILKERMQLRVYWPRGAHREHGCAAVWWWTRNVEGSIYDYRAIPALLLKAALGPIMVWPVGWEWTWYCTEGVADAWRIGAELDPWRKPFPTPRTTEKRAAQGTMEDVTQEVLLKGKPR